MNKTEENKKLISIMIPCFNEVENVEAMVRAVEAELTENCSKYDYEIVIIDNASTDGTRDIIERICKTDKKVKAIFNVTNFGQFNSPFHGLCQCGGDCVIPVCCDFQDPVEMIPVFIEKWEQGHKVVSAVKSSSRENPILYFFRSIYYKLIKGMSSVKMIEHFTGFGLYDHTFIELIRKLDDPIPFMRGIVAEYGEGFNMIEVEYTQAKRRAGKTHNSFYSLYDAAMLSFTSYTKIGLRIATFLGFGCSMVSLVIAIVYLVKKLSNWYAVEAGHTPLMIGVFLIGGVQLFFIGLIGEYILNINTRVIHRPVVVEEKRINFDGDDDE